MRPIFIVGCGRSGTSLLYEMLCCHRDLGWFSNLTDRWPALPMLAAFSNLYPFATTRGVRGRAVPRPVEGYGFWNELNRIDGLPSDQPLTERDVSPDAQRFAAARIATVLRFQRKPRFVNKATRNVRRLRYVDALVDDAVFIDVVRDPRATVASLLRVGFWPETTVWSERNITPRAWERLGKDPVELAARLWASDVARSLEDRSRISEDRLLDVRYEELVDDPRTTIARVARFAGLPLTKTFSRATGSFRIEDRNPVSIAQLSADQLATIKRIAGPSAELVGYNL